MPFNQGQSGNPDGRPKGTRNKLNTKVKGFITTLLEENYETVQAAFNAMDSKAKVKYWIEMLPYVVPKMQSVSASVDWEKLTDEELDEIIDRLKNGNGQ